MGASLNTPRNIGFVLVREDYENATKKGTNVISDDLELIQALARYEKLARERGCGRLEWAVLQWNEPAIRFYEALGARPMSGWTTYRVTGHALVGLAKEA